MEQMKPVQLGQLTGRLHRQALFGLYRIHVPARWLSKKRHGSSFQGVKMERSRRTS